MLYRGVFGRAFAHCQTYSTRSASQNLVEKIVQKYAVDLPENHVVRSGDFVYIRPQHVMTHDNTAAVMHKFKSIQAKSIRFPEQIVYTLDHDVQNKSEKNLAKYKDIELFAKEHGVDFYPAGRGIGHQVLVEEGYARPGVMTVASDSHSNMYGGVGCLGTPVVRTDAAALWATGQTWWQVPPVAKIEFQGKLQPGVTGKDIIIALCGFFNNDEVLNHCCEFTGEGVTDLPVDDRLAIANMTTEWGALAGVFPIDRTTIEFFEKRASYLAHRGLAGVPSDSNSKNGENVRINDNTVSTFAQQRLQADQDAFYSKVLTLDLSTVRPHVSGPNHVKVMKSVSEVEKEKLKIQKAYLVSCVNSRADDIAEAAKVMRGKQVAEGVEFYVAAASNEVQQQTTTTGDWQTLIEAGAHPLPPGCGPCVGLGTGLLKDGEIGISATNRNFKGRMGHPNAQAYLASPAVVAASAVAGYICGPQKMSDCSIVGTVTSHTPPATRSATNLLSGFPSKMSGQVLFCHQDNLNTDGIYAGKWTYVEHLSQEEMAQVAMENYDPIFPKIVQKGDILVGGFNFGTGSSREQAATALKYAGIQCLLAGSFSETFKRNSINNAFLLLEVPELVQDLVQTVGRQELTVRIAESLVIDFVNSKVSFQGKSYLINPVGAAAQELILTGGLEKWIQKRLSS
eukprot:Lithocolla_globosa_v1_NODE_202_length_5196_cov_7.727290.p2 type:complete len:679 gc:universal NODE_202_length_5196_cov_7.727290:2523-487(-)